MSDIQKQSGYTVDGEYFPTLREATQYSTGKELMAAINREGTEVDHDNVLELLKKHPEALMAYAKACNQKPRTGKKKAKTEPASKTAPAKKIA